MVSLAQQNTGHFIVSGTAEAKPGIPIVQFEALKIPALPLLIFINLPVSVKVEASSV
ncbi:MAG: hypothetical protein WCR72_00135 [Bacteroidota bacterium]